MCHLSRAARRPAAPAWRSRGVLDCPGSDRWRGRSIMTRAAPAPPGAGRPSRRRATACRSPGATGPAREPDAPAVLLLHGVDSTRDQTARGTPPWLNGLGYAVLAIDFRGHGGSGAGRAQLRPRPRRATPPRRSPSCGRDAPERRVGVIGISLGGAAALLGDGGPLPVAGDGAAGASIPTCAPRSSTASPASSAGRSAHAGRAVAQLSVLAALRRRARAGSRRSTRSGAIAGRAADHRRDLRDRSTAAGRDTQALYEAAPGTEDGSGWSPAPTMSRSAAIWTDDYRSRVGAFLRDSSRPTLTLSAGHRAPSVTIHKSGTAPSAGAAGCWCRGPR